jgi:hypothetical protein
LVYGGARPSIGVRCVQSRAGKLIVDKGVEHRARSPVPAADPAALHKRMMQLLSSLWLTRALGTFVRLGIADALESGTDCYRAIARERGLIADRLFRLLRALSTAGIVRETEPGRFALTPLGRLLGSRSSTSMRTAALLLNDYLADTWADLDTALIDGGTAFDRRKGRPFFDWLAQHPRQAEQFHRMMVEVHGAETPAILAAYDFGASRHIVDVGGGNGSLLSAILAAFPGRQATLLDLPPGIEAARRGEGGPLPGVTLTAGDAFTAVPEGGDLYLLRHLLHDYEDADCLRILASVRRAMAPQARVLVLEKPIPPDDRPSPGRWLDLHIMLLTGGRERTVEEYERLFVEVGLELARVVPTAHAAMDILELTAAGS